MEITKQQQLHKEHFMRNNQRGKIKKSTQLYGYLIENIPDGIKITHKDQAYLLSQLKELLSLGLVSVNIKLKEIV